MRILIIPALIIALLSWKAPVLDELANTKWTGTANVPDPTDVLLAFRNDSMLVSINNEVIETMSYQVKGDTLVIKKLSGTSPCSDETGRYKYTVKESVLKISVILDACNIRSGALNGNDYKKKND